MDGRLQRRRKGTSSCARPAVSSNERRATTASGSRFRCGIDWSSAPTFAHPLRVCAEWAGVTPRSWHRSPCRGATAVEYALGAALVAVALIVGLESVASSADEAYDDRQSLISTPVTDGAAVVSGPPPAAPPPPVVPLPPPLAVPYTASASATTALVNGGHWTATVTVTVDPAPDSGTVTGTYQPSNASTATPFSCTLSTGSCSFTTGTQHKNHVDWVDFTVTDVTATPEGTTNTPLSTRAQR